MHVRMRMRSSAIATIGARVSANGMSTPPDYRLLFRHATCPVVTRVI